MEHDLIVIGAGPGGYVAAIRGAQLGLNVACVEKEPALGGTCLRVGCIPSKALLESSELYEKAKHGLGIHGVRIAGAELDLATMLKRKDQVVTMLTKGIDGLFKKNKITRYTGHASIVAAGKIKIDDKEIAAKNIIIATGSKVAPLKGVNVDGRRIVTSAEALSFSEVPKRLIVIGAGFIGLELGSVWRRLGSQVTVLEYLPRIFPGMDTEIATDAQKIFEKQGLQFRLGRKVTAARVENEECVVEAEGDEPLRADRVLLAVGRIPNTDQLGLQNVGVKTDARGRIEVDSHFATNIPGIFAIGDVIAGPMLAHKAEEEGVACVEQIVNGWSHINYDTIPGVAYTHPEIATVGKTEEQLKEAGVPYKKGTFPFMANGRARSLADTDGKVKILAHKETDRILGVHILGPRAGDIIAEAVAAMAFGASAEDLARTCHAHPTLSEAVKEAALSIDGRAIHI